MTGQSTAASEIHLDTLPTLALEVRFALSERLTVTGQDTGPGGITWLDGNAGKWNLTAIIYADCTTGPTQPTINTRQASNTVRATFV